MIKFNNITYKNFLSTGDQPISIQLDRSPTTLIAGTNGSGKSTILDVIFFALFGKAFRNISKPRIVNSINNGHLEVVLDFTIGKKKYKIVRGMKPNKFEIYENDKLIDQDAASRDYQKYLEDSILGGLNEKVFKQVVVIGSADYTPFMQLRANDRREVIEELLDITIFSQMLDIAKERMSILRSELQDLDYAIDLSSEKIKLHEEVSQRAKTDNADKKKLLNEQIDEQKQKIEACNNKIKEIQPVLVQLREKSKGYDLVSKSLEDLQSLSRDLNSTRNSHKKKLTFFTNNDKCPTCLQDITQQYKDKLKNLSKEKIDELSSAVDRVEEQVEKKLGYLEKFEKINDAINKSVKQIEDQQSQIRLHTQLIERIKQDIEGLEVKKPNEKITKLRKENKQLIDDRQKKLDEQQYYTVAAGMLKDGGIKTKIIRQYIPLMNKIINDYLVRFGLPIEFTLDENFTEVIKSRHRDSFQYNNFSEGEKQRIDTALLLAWRQIARAKNTTNTNLLIMDETFDSSLDAGATEELLNMLLEMDKNTNIFIISHKQDLSDKLRSHIEFEKQGNFTCVKKQPD